MFLAIIFLAGCLASGFALMRLLPLNWYKSELAAASVGTGLFAGSWTLFLTSWAFGYTAGIGLTIMLVIALCLGIWKRPASPLLPKFVQEKRNWPWLIVATISLLLFSWLFYTHMLQVKNDAYYSAGSTWGDLALHLSLVTRFAEQPEFTWDFPIFTGGKLSYPLLIDFLSGMLYRFGFSLPVALFIPGWLLAIALTQLIFFFILRSTKNANVAAVSLLLFLVSGGAAGIFYFWHDWVSSSSSLFTFLGSLPKQYTNLWSDGIYFSNIVNDFLLPQRGILFGLSLFSLACSLLYSAWHQKDLAQKFLGGATLIIGFLPLAHTHTFFVLWGVLGFLAITQAIKQKTFFTPWTQAVFTASMIAAPQIIWQMSSNFNDDFSRFQFGWMKKPTENIFLFWLRNMGIPFIFFFTNFWLIKKVSKQDNWHLYFYIPLAILFCITNVYLFQPHNYDNMKFMIYSYLAICIYMAWSLYFIAQYRPGGRLVMALIIIASCITGSLAILRETYISWQFSSTDEIAAAQQFKAITPADAIVLTSDQHNHFVPTLTGRRILMGYRGWLWTYGIKYTTVERDVRAMLSGAPTTPSLLKKYNISFVTITPSERQDFGANQAYFDQHSQLVMETGLIRVYDVRDFSLQ
ncbi:MAG: hypothetical protein HYZ63_00585 [Candidatus Andersenbacteria bacterium]|nr:hypothetical protein [Candidatus Andersenbacteria bacterium]